MEIDKEELIKWLRERMDNCLRLAAEKTGTDSIGWLVDASYFSTAIELLRK